MQRPGVTRSPAQTHSVLGRRKDGTFFLPILERADALGGQVFYVQPMFPSGRHTDGWLETPTIWACREGEARPEPPLQASDVSLALLEMSSVRVS